MNNRYFGLPLLLCFMVVSISSAGYAQTEKTAVGEEFFIVASIDLAKAQILLKHPTEVTSLLNINDKTKYTDQAGKTLQPSDLHTGDTVWVVYSGTGASATASRIRKGPMTGAELHRLYLDYPEIK
jgi:hypothetical protein